MIAYFDPGFRFPSSLKVSLGADRRLAWGTVGTVDILYTRAMTQYAVRDVNLGPPTGAAAGEGGRTLYGSIDPATGGFGALAP